MYRVVSVRVPPAFGDNETVPDEHKAVQLEALPFYSADLDTDDETPCVSGVLRGNALWVIV